MKKIAMLLALLLCLFGTALAQEADAYWTSSDDLYFHANGRCGAGENRVPISAKAGAAFGKGVCPVCIPLEDDGRPPVAVSRGGTIVVKFSDAWLNAHELTGVFGFSGESSYPGVQGLRQLGAYLHGESYDAFLEAWLESGFAEGRASTPYILPVNGALVMHRRHIGPYWYIIMRPQEKFSGAWSMYWRVSSYRLRAEADTLYSEFDRQTVEETRSLAVEAMHGSAPVLQRQSGSLVIEVYNALNGNIAVIREENPGGSLENVQLMIGGRNEGIELSGYMDGAAAVYCCMLTDAELEALQANARMEIRRTEAVNMNIYRVIASDGYQYYSRSSDELLVSIGKLNGLDPVDGDFRHIDSGSAPDRFVLYGEDTVEICRFTENGMETVYPDSANEDIRAERITPLFWYGEKCVFLMENHKYQDYTPADRLFTGGIEYGRRCGSAPEDEFASYTCWLADENGRAISGMNNQAFTLLEDGRIQLEDFEGNTIFCGPFTDD